MNPIDRLQCSINPEPITIKGIKTSHPNFFLIYCGKKGTIPQFTAEEEKRKGTALGAIFKKVRPLGTDKQWMGKVGHPQGLLRNDPNTIRTRTKKEMNLDTIREKLAYDLFQELGRGLFLVPKTRLSLQPILNNFTLWNELAQDYVQRGIKESLFIMSFFLEGYSDLAEAQTLDGNDEISFMNYQVKYHRPPEFILSPDQILIPIEGLMELLGVGRCLADVDVLGGRGCNAGFVWVQDRDQKIIAARAVKIDPGYAFRFIYKDTKYASESFVINTKEKLGECRNHLKDLKDLQTSTGNYDAIIEWHCLTPNQQDEFLSVLLNTCRYFNSQGVLDLLFYREGKFSYPDSGHSHVAYMPKELADQMSQEMKYWMNWQLEIYAEPLEKFKNNHPEQALRIRYIDRHGELALPMQQETFPIRELFTELVIIDSHDKKEKNILPQVDFFKDYQQSLASKIISLEKLFENSRKVLLIGKPGIGKSTLCQKMAHDWASGKLWNDAFDVLFWIPLRELNDVEMDSELSDNFLKTALSQLFKEIPNIQKLCLSHKMLLILDGYDEAIDILARSIENLIEKLPCHILITSRPGKTENLKVDQVVENVGFSDKQIKTYIDNFIKRNNKDVSNQIRGQELYSMIKESPQLYPIAHIPLQLQMILSIYETTPHAAKTSCLTKLYQLMTNKLYDWYLRGEKQEEKETHLLQLGKIAAIGLQLRELIIPHEKVHHLMKDSLLETGILKKVEGKQPAYCFVHLTFQEYLAALYFHSKSNEKQKRLIVAYRHNYSYHLVLAFLAGLNYFKSQELASDQNETPKIDWFFDALCKKNSFFFIILLLSPNYLELILRCLNECEGFRGRLLSVENFVEENPQIWDIPHSDGYTPLHSTANQRQTQALLWLVEHYSFLLEKKEKHSTFKTTGVTTFWLCAEKGNLEALKELYQKNPKQISEFTNDGLTPLHAAAFNGYNEAMGFLLEKDPSLISKFSDDGLTPLHMAAFNGHVEAMRFLLEKDPSLISKFWNDGLTPFHLAAFNGHVEAMRFLLEKVPSLISDVTNDGQTPLHAAACTGRIEAMRFLLEEDPSLISKFSNDGFTPLHMAASNGHIEAMRLLLEKDPSLISKFTDDGATPLHAAASEGKIEAMRFLLEEDPSLISKFSKDDLTPLHEAASNGHVGAMRLLLEKDPLLISKFAKDDWTPLHVAALNGHVEAMRFLLEKDLLLISKFRNDGWTPFHSAASKGHVEAMRFLLGKDPLLISKFMNNGWTPLHSAASNGHVETMRFLLEKDLLLISKFKNNGWTPFHSAALNGHVGAMRLLFEKDPLLISKVTNEGLTPLHAAAEGGHVEAGKWLFQQDPSLLNAKDKNGATALSIAQKGEHKEFVDWIQSLIQEEPQTQQGSCNVM